MAKSAEQREAERIAREIADRQEGRIIQCSATPAVQEALSARDFRVGAEKKDDGTVELLLMGPVGFDFDGGLSARGVVDFLAENRDKPVHVRINSPGGLAFDGITIHNALAKHDAKVTVTVEGRAASAAAIIAMAGDPVRVFENANIFIHRAWGLAIGNTTVMADLAEELDQVDRAIARTFASKTGLSEARVLELMTGKADGTFLDADRAKELRFADEVVKIREGSTASNATGCTGCGPWAGRRLAALLNRAIDRIDADDDDDRSRADVIRQMARAAGIEPGTVNQILDGSIECPPLRRLRGFATVDGLPSFARQRQAAEDDGCEYEEENLRAELEELRGRERAAREHELVVRRLELLELES